MRSYLLDKRLATNTDYTMEEDTALVITEIGTDDTAKVVGTVDGVPCVEFITDIAALITNPSNRNPLFNLGDLYIVVPQNKILRFKGTEGSFVRIKGHLLKFGPGESLPASYVARFNEQGKKFYSYQAGALEGATTLAAGSATNLISFECPAGEKWTFDSYLMAQATVSASKDYDITIRLLKQDQPLDNLLNSKLLLGLTQHATPYPPNDTDGAVAANLKDKKIELNPGEVLRIQAVNTSESEKTLDAETSKALIVGVQEYLKP